MHVERQFVLDGIYARICFILQGDTTRFADWTALGMSNR